MRYTSRETEQEGEREEEKDNHQAISEQDPELGKELPGKQGLIARRKGKNDDDAGPGEGIGQQLGLKLTYTLYPAARCPLRKERVKEGPYRLYNMQVSRQLLLRSKQTARHAKARAREQPCKPL